jgi:hypothetical protein
MSIRGMLMEVAKRRIIDEFDNRAMKKAPLLVKEVANHRLSLDEAARRLVER